MHSHSRSRTLVLQRQVALALAVAAMLVFARVLLVAPQPPQPYPSRLELPLSADFFLAQLWLERPGPWYRATTVFLAITGLFAAGIGVALARNALKVAAARQMMGALCLGSFAFCWFVFANGSAPIRGLAASAPWASIALDLGVAAMLGYACALLTRFFLWYPRPLTEDEWGGYLRRRKRERTGGLASLRSWMLHGGLGSLPEPALQRLEAARHREFRRFSEPRFAAWVVGAAVAGALAWHVFLDPGVRQAVRGLPPFAKTATSVLISVLVLPCALLPMLAFAAMTQALEIQRELGSDAHRRQVEWMYLPIIALSCAFALAMAAMGLWAGAAWLTGRGDAQAILAMSGWVALALGAFIVPAFLAGLTFSIFNRGALDPRLAFRRVSLWSLLAISLTFVFVLTERFVATQVVALLGFGQETGTVFAGAVVAMTFMPMRVRTEKVVGALAERWLPAPSLEGERMRRAITFSDLSGYSAVSAVDEPRALLLAALLQRQARAHAASHEGRVVKSLGDAVILDFESAAEAVPAVQALHAGMSAASMAVGVEPLPLHSGIHCGEVTVRPDGDVFGATVNLASRLQDFATAGRIVLSSEAVAEARLEPARVEALGPARFKNIPDPVPCFALREA